MHSGGSKLGVEDEDTTTISRYVLDSRLKYRLTSMEGTASTCASLPTRLARAGELETLDPNMFVPIEERMVRFLTHTKRNEDLRRQ